ncbi:hypothetical protein MASR1M68_14350 [Elusimicrobiota bacterium]
MKCNEMEFLISLHMDNRLSGQELSDLLQHFEQCHRCRQTYKDFLDIRNLLAKENNIKISADFEKNLMKKIKNINNGAVLHSNNKRKIFLMAAGFLFVVISSVSFFSKEPKNIEYDFEWYYNISQENNDETYSESAVSLILNY